MNGSFFDKIGVADMEKVHSAVIGWMFSDDCCALNKQQKSELLCSLFNVRSVQAFNSFEVKVEHHDIDILIITGNDTCWVIENKVKSSQHSNQLDKYYDIINGIPVKIGRKTHIIEDYKALNKHFCYLTLVNEQPQCINNVWVNTTYKDFSKALKDALFIVNQNYDYIILKEYLCCITNLAKALDDFINNHQQYPYVFVDRPNKRKELAIILQTTALKQSFKNASLHISRTKLRIIRFLIYQRLMALRWQRKRTYVQLKDIYWEYNSKTDHSRLRYLMRIQRRMLFGMYGVRK